MIFRQSSETGLLFNAHAFIMVTVSFMQNCFMTHSSCAFYRLSQFWIYQLEKILWINMEPLLVPSLLMRDIRF